MERFFSGVMRHFGKLGALIELGRPWNGVITGLFAILGLFLAGGQITPFNISFLFLVFTLSYMAGATLNDIFDTDVDKINMPFRPLMDGRIANNTAWNLSVSMHIILFLTSFLINFNLTIMVAVFFLCSALYSAPPIQLSRKSILSHFDLSLTAFVIPFYAGIVYATGNFTINSTILNFMISLFFLFVSIFLLKDFKDIKGDGIKNKVTPVNQIGPAKTKMLSMLTTLIFFPLTLYTFTFIRPLNTALIPLFVLLISALLFSEYKITEKPERYFGTSRLLLFLLVLTFFT